MIHSCNSLCPNRFYINNYQLIIDAASKFLSTEEIVLVKEVKLPGEFGRVDFIAVNLNRDKNGILDFVAIEIQTNQTTSTGGLTDAITEHENTLKFSKNQYKFGLNTYHQIKTSFTQCLNKSQLFKQWGKKFVWIMEYSVFENLKSRFSLTFTEFNLDDEIFFYSYRLEYDPKERMYFPKLIEAISTNRDYLLNAYNIIPTSLPKEDEFIKRIEKKMGLK